jgi:hypothetical protein
MFLHMLALAAPSKTLVEVGTLGGYSAAWLACAISGGSLHTIERDAKRAAFAQQNLHAAGLASRVHVINEPALDAICKLRATMQDGSVGLVFLDAQKSEYISYFQQLERLVAPVSFLLPPPSSLLPPSSWPPRALQRLGRVIIHPPLAGRVGGGGQLPGYTACVDRHDRSTLLAFIAFRIAPRSRAATNCNICSGAGDGDRAHMHEFNEFMARQRQQWDVV